MKHRVSRLLPYALALAIAIALAPVTAQEAEPKPEPKRGPLSVTYIGNEGFMIESGGVKVLVDALYRDGVPGYVVIPEERRRLLETAQPPFADVTLILATHYHADHFDPGAVLEHLKASPKTVFLSTPQAVDLMRELPDFDTVRGRVRPEHPQEGERVRAERPGLVLHVLNLHHGRERPVQNLGFIIEMRGVKILHVGDTEATVKDFQANLIREEEIDLVFLPYWYLTAGNEKAIEEAIAPGRIVATHLPPPSDPQGLLQTQGGFEKLAAGIEGRFPKAVVFRQEMETRELP